MKKGFQSKPYRLGSGCSILSNLSVLVKGSPIKGLVKRKNTPSIKKIHFLIDS